MAVRRGFFSCDAPRRISHIFDSVRAHVYIFLPRDFIFIMKTIQNSENDIASFKVVSCLRN